MDYQAVQVRDPFNPRGREATWAVCDLESKQIVSDKMDHYDAMRKNADHRIEAVVRTDRMNEDMVFASLHDSRSLMAASTVDISGVLERMDMDDFVELQGHAYKGESISSKILSSLVLEENPRAERLDTYVRETATPGDDGSMPTAKIKLEEDDVMNWLERNRPEIHEEIEYRASLNKPSFAF